MEGHYRAELKWRDNIETETDIILTRNTSEVEKSPVIAECRQAVKYKGKKKGNRVGKGDVEWSEDEA